MFTGIVTAIGTIAQIDIEHDVLFPFQPFAIDILPEIPARRPFTTNTLHLTRDHIEIAVAI